MSAIPQKRKSLALHATLPPAAQLPSQSSLMRRCLSIRLTMTMPSVAQRPGAQSANVTRTGTGSYGVSGSEMGLACADEMLASRNAHQPNANCDDDEVGGAMSVSNGVALDEGRPARASLDQPDTPGRTR